METESALPASGATSDPSLLDLEGTLQRLGGDRAVFAGLAKVFAEDAPKLLDCLAAEVAAKRGEEVRSLAHALRGLVSNFGAVALTQQLRELEELGARNDLACAQNLLDEIHRQAAKLHALLNAHC